MPPAFYTDVLLPLPLPGTFTYAVSPALAEGLQPGMRVLVPFGKKKVYIALVSKLHSQAPAGIEIKEVLSVIDPEPVVLESQFRLWTWISEYYLCAQGEVFKAALPLSLKLERKTRTKTSTPQSTKTPSVLNPAQQQALDEIKHAFEETDVALLHGVTSSGKTEIYIHLIQEAIEKHQQVLYLLPEIALTTQIINRLKSVFGQKVDVYHSKYSVSERIKTWNRMLAFGNDLDNDVHIVLGVRSAIFLPFKNPGLIIVDEEHENTYKQFDPAPRYHARDTAIVMASQHQAKVLLGTATPAIETYYNCISGKYRLVELNERYLQLQLPEITVENTRELRRRKQMQSHFSPALLQQIEEALGNHEQVILFQNRRGFSLFLECEQCGEVPRCKHCDVSLTYHKKDNRLYCHYCGYSMPVPPVCPVCKQGTLKMRGFGTEKIEEDLALFFPQARIERLDLDAVRSRKAYEMLIARFEAKASDILVGTQMVSKGLDFDNVRLVGIMNADTMLSYPDFRAHERSYQLMAQVSGRAGRKNSRGKVIIQGSDHNHPIIGYVVDNNYIAMYNDQVAERKKFGYPPFSRLVEVMLKHRQKEVVDSAAAQLAVKLKEVLGEKVMGPEYPLVSRIQNYHLKRLLVKIQHGKRLARVKQQLAECVHELNAIPDFRQVHITLDVDPY
ncbi:MAG: primosomal protein N' [Bacteroidales bacterium]|nr:primosomal protein N' [Bacteroidales bacterium]